MSGIGTGYDLSTTTYSPDGKVFQVDYACKAVDNGGLVLGVRCKDGVVLGVEKLLAMKMLVPGANRRIAAVDRHAGMAGTGLAPDARQIVAVQVLLRRQDPCANPRRQDGTLHAPVHAVLERPAVRGFLSHGCQG